MLSEQTPPLWASRRNEPSGFSWLALVPDWALLLSRQPSFVLCDFLDQLTLTTPLFFPFTSTLYSFICFFTLQVDIPDRLHLFTILGSLFTYARKAAHYWSDEKRDTLKVNVCYIPGLDLTHRDRPGVQAVAHSNGWYSIFVSIDVIKDNQ